MNLAGSWVHVCLSPNRLWAASWKETPSIRKPSLQLVRHHLRPRTPRAKRVLLDFAFPDLAAAEGVEGVFVFATDGDAGDAAAIRDGEDDLGGAVGGVDMNADLRACLGFV